MKCYFFFEPSTIPFVSPNMTNTSPSTSQIDSNFPAATPPDYDQIDLILDLSDRDEVLPDLVADWSGISAVSLRDDLTPPFNQKASLMPISFTYFLTKDSHPNSIAHNVDRATKYVMESNLPRFHTA